MLKSLPAVGADKIVKREAEWRAELTLEQYQVMRQHGTERVGSSPLNREKRESMFMCASCGEPLFASDAKFESGSGWPSFDKAASEDAVDEHVDRSHFVTRTEVRCAHCEGHLGHVFPDGPQETTRLRYCINGAALEFKPADP